MTDKIKVNCEYYIHKNCVLQHPCYHKIQVAIGDNKCSSKGITEAIPTKPMVEVEKVIKDLEKHTDEHCSCFGAFSNLITRYKQLLEEK